MKVVEEVNSEFPLKWVDLNFLPDSRGQRKEIYLEQTENLVEGLIFLFYNLFGDYKKDIYIHNNSWWDFCLDTWNIVRNEYNYSLDEKSKESADYLKILYDSKIKPEYSGICKCLNWDKFLPVILNCIISHQAPYSPIFYNEENNFLFYFHHTGSIGFYYKESTGVIERIIETANQEYEVRL